MKPVRQHGAGGFAASRDVPKQIGAPAGRAGRTSSSENQQSALSERTLRLLADFFRMSCLECPAGTTSEPGSVTCDPVGVCPKGRPKLCPGKKGHKDKCCPRDNTCDYS